VSVLQQEMMWNVPEFKHWVFYNLLDKDGGVELPQLLFQLTHSRVGEEEEPLALKKSKSVP